MPTIYLVRHGRASAGFDEDLDPGLDDMGRTQAFMVVEAMKKEEPISIISSPLKRCQETAAPLAKRWGQDPQIVKGVSEIPSPTDDTKERGEWLNKVLSGEWADADAKVQKWRKGVIKTLRSFNQDAIVFSHFVAINAAVGHAMGSEKVINFSPDNGSITKLSIDGDIFEVLAQGKEANTRVR